MPSISFKMLIAERPTDTQEIKAIIRKNHFSETTKEQDQSDTDDSEEISADDFDSKKSIKSQSMFGKKFQDILNQLSTELAGHEIT